MKTIGIIAIIVLSSLLLLPYLLQSREFKVYSDDALRKEALGRGMAPVPKTYEELLKVVDTPKNPMNKEKIALGRELYFDTLLSKNRDISCGTCHTFNPDKKNNKVLLDTLISDKNRTNCVMCHLDDQSGTDRFATSVGHDGKEHPFHLNTMTIMNASLAKFLTWDGEVKNVEEQAGLSIESHFKMNLTQKEAVQRVKSNSVYAKKFAKAFKYELKNTEEAVSFKNIEKAIGAYVRTLLTRSSYDRFLEGDNNAINAMAKKGLANFMNFGCKGCHTGMSVGGQSVQRFPLRNFASIHDLRPNFQLYPEYKLIDNTFPFENRGGFLGRADTNFFRVPILRNITKTSPYFHNGSVDKIREAVEIMGRHQLGINLTPIQIDEIVEFLKTLDGEIVDYSIDTQSPKETL